MSKKRVTSKMVAELAGVSQTTVSFVMNNVEEQNIRPETANRVLNAAKQLGYVPDAAARNLARGISDNIALVLTQPHDAVFSDEYVSYVLTGIVQVMRKQGFRVVVEMVETLKQSEMYMSLAKGKEVAGMIVLPYQAHKKDVSNIEQLIEDGFPLVSIGHMSETPSDHDGINTVFIDSTTGIRAAMEHLINLGHTRIAAISYAPKGSTHESQKRVQIYTDILSEYGIAYDESLVKFGNYEPETAVIAMQALLAQDNLPTAVFALNDVMAFGAMKAIRQHGLSVPDDIAVVGYDGIHLAAFASPALTTVHAPNLEQGRYAAEMLLKLINDNPQESQHIELQPELIIRESCGYYLKQ